MSPDSGYSGRTRRKTTARGVVVAERLSKGLITVGWIGTIVAVTLIMVFLVAVVVPLFGGASVGAEASTARATDAAAAAPLHALEDDYRALAAVVQVDGTLE